MSYVPTGGMASTLALAANTLSAFAAWQAIVGDGVVALGRIVPEASISWGGPDAGASGSAVAWNGDRLAEICAPLAIISYSAHEDYTPALRTWRDSGTLSIGLLLPGTVTDTPVDAELRAIDQVQSLAEAFHAASDAGTFLLSKTPFARMPVPFSPLAPPALRGAWLAQLQLVL